MNREAQILLVEDNPMDVALTKNAFKEAHLSNEIHVAGSAEEALGYIKGERDYSDRMIYPLPDIILLDLKMPGLGGFEFLKVIKSTPLLKRIPVIILTSSRQEEDIERSYDYGANSYLVKPIEFDGFQKVVAEVSDYWFTLNVSASLQ
jgi:CheY-like chemotaxis protein